MNLESGLYRPRQQQAKLVGIFRECCDVRQSFQVCYFAARFLIFGSRNTFITELDRFKTYNFLTAFLYRARYLHIMLKVSKDCRQLTFRHCRLLRRMLIPTLAFHPTLASHPTLAFHPTLASHPVLNISIIS